MAWSFKAELRRQNEEVFSAALPIAGLASGAPCAASAVISRPRISADEFGLLSVTDNWEFVVGNCGGASTTDGIDFSDTGTGGVEEGAET